MSWTEGELVDLQRKARSCFSRVDEIANYMFNRSEKFSESQVETVNFAADLARQVSDEIDRLADGLRRERP